MSLLAASALTIRIGGIAICAGFDFRLQRGELWALLGGNGAGKTTLLHTLSGLRRAEAGSIRIHGKDLSEWRRKALAGELGIMFQDSQDTFPCSVLETALTGLHPHLPFWKVEGPEEITLAEQALAAVELGDMGRRRVDSLSGGERRRLAIAALLIQNPLIWLLDEPSNHLDLRHQVTLLALVLERVKARDGGMVMSLHDVNLALRFCTHAALMIDRATILSGPIDEVVNTGNLERLYGHAVRCVADGEGRSFYYPK